MDYGAALLDETRAFAELIRRGDPALPVPTCPEWNLEQLFRHVGRGNLWAAQIIADRMDHGLDPREVVGGKPPAQLDASIDWLNDGAQQILDAVAQTGPDTPVWTFVGPRPSAWWVRRRLHEATVHRADAALAMAGQMGDFALSAELAADGISELLDLLAARPRRDGQPWPLVGDDVVHLHATDTDLGSDGQWVIRRSSTTDTLSWAHERGAASVTLSGSARELFLVFMRRAQVADTDITVSGDPQVWQNWVDHTAF